MKVKVYYTALCSHEIDVDDKYEILYDDDLYDISLANELGVDVQNYFNSKDISHNEICAIWDKDDTIPFIEY